jgi:hypothetical protein
MPFEKPESHHAERMSKEEAQEEANMLRVHLGVSPESGKMSKPSLTEVEGNESQEEDLAFIERKPNAEDYDSALKALARLEQDRQYESSAFMQGIIKANQLVRSFGVGGLFAGRALNAAIDAITGDSFKESWKEGKELTDSEWRMVFNDANSRLRRLRAAAKEFGEEEMPGQN